MQTNGFLFCPDMKRLKVKAMRESRRRPIKDNLYDLGGYQKTDFKLLGSGCTTCGEKHFPQRSICPNCSTRHLNKIFLSSYGTILTYTIVRQTSPLWKGPVPYIIAVVRLDDGVEITSHLIECNLEKVTIGLRVRVVPGKLRETDDGEEIIVHMFEIMEGGRLCAK